MGKGDKQKSNKEVKKPKQEKSKAPAASTLLGGGKDNATVAGKKIK